VTSPDSPWSGWANAEIYDRFVRDGRIYRELNRRLVELAEVGAARRVLDLACGTGATARACLARLPPDGELVGVDGSAEMVAVARERTPDPRARFEVAAAAELAAAAPGPFDRAVCNAAFWQFPSPAAVLRALAAVLAEGALLVFNLPASRMGGEAFEAHPFQVALSRALGGAPSRERIEPGALAALLRETGFETVRRDRFVYRGRQLEMMDLMAIPAMLRRTAPDLTEAERGAALAEARRRTDPAQPVAVPWLYYVVRRVRHAPFAAPAADAR